MTFDFALALSGILIIALTVLPFWRTGLWWVRIFDFPCAQLTFLGSIIGIAWVVLWLKEEPLIFSTGMIPFLAASLIIQGYRIYPYTVFASKESPSPDNVDHPQRTFSILAFNVLMTNRNHHQLLTIIHKYDPDLILLTEANHWWEQAIRSIESRYNFTLKKPLENTYGMLMYSRFPLQHCDVRFLVEDDVPSFYTTVRMPSGETVDFYGLHPRPPRVNQDVYERDAELLIVGQTIAQQKRPAIVAGDLNDVAWSHTTRLFRRLSGLLDPRIGRGFFNTFPTHLPFLRFPMDHIFHSEQMQLQQLDVLEPSGSDHYPIFARLYMNGSQQSTHTVSQDIRSESQEKIVEGLTQAQVNSST